MKLVKMVAFILTVLGALNWGLVGLLNFNLVESLVGGFGLTQITYILVGASAVYVALTHTSEWMPSGKK